MAALLQDHCDSVQVTETCLAFVGSDKAKFFLLSLRLDERIEDIMNLSHKARDSACVHPERQQELHQQFQLPGDGRILIPCSTERTEVLLMALATPLDEHQIC